MRTNQAVSALRIMSMSVLVAIASCSNRDAHTTLTPGEDSSTLSALISAQMLQSTPQDQLYNPDPLTYALTSEVAMAQQRPDVASAALEQLATVVPDKKIYQEGLQTALLAKDYPRALHFTLAWMEKDPQNKKLKQLAMILLAAQPEEAMKLANQALEQNPNDYELRYSRSLIALQLQQKELAEKDLRQVVQQAPNYNPALNALGYLLLENNSDLTEAQTYITRAYQLNPKDPATLDSMGWLQYHQGKYQAAEDFLQNAYHASPDPIIAVHLIEVLVKEGNYPSAKIVWTDATQRYPDIPELQALAHLFNNN